MQLILFTSADPGRAAMAASFFNVFACPSRACAIAGVSDPAVPFDDLVRVAMREMQPAMVLLPPTRLTAQLEACAAQAVRLVASPEAPSAADSHWADWDIPDPCRQPVERVREVRDAISESVQTYIRDHEWQPA